MIMYRDYSLRKRIETTIKADESKVDRLISSRRKDESEKKADKVAHDQKLQCLEIDITKPLC